MKTWHAALCLAMAVALAGCGGYPEYLGWGAKPNVNGITQTQYQSSNYEVIGPVRATGEGICILGLYAGGKDGQGLLWEQAQLMTQGNFTGIKDVAAWTEYESILAPVVCKYKTTYIGTVVRERRAGVAPAPAPATLPMPAPVPVPTP